MLQTVWGWQPALYLFLGGMGAGAFIMAAVLYLIDRAKHRLIICASMWAAMVSLGVGLMLLLAELIHPLRGMLMWQSFDHFTTWMTYGAWGAFGAVVVFAVSAILATPLIAKWLAAKWKWFAKHGQGLRRVLAITGIALGAFVAVYTGMLLMDSGGVPLWDTLLLPALFTVSALDTGVALVEVISVVLGKRDRLAPKARTLMERIVVALVVLEVIVLAAFLMSMLGADVASAAGATAVQSAEMLTNGILAPYFWGMVVACGLAVPFVMAIAGLALHKKGENAKNAIMAVGAVGALVGGCELRFLILAAGIHAPLVATTVMSLLG